MLDFLDVPFLRVPNVPCPYVFCSPSVGVVIGFGNLGDSTYVVLPITGRIPALETVTQKGYTPTPGQTESVTFNLPQSVGPNRTVRVVPFILSQVCELFGGRFY